MDDIVHDIREGWTEEEWQEYYEFLADNEERDLAEVAKDLPAMEAEL